MEKCENCGGLISNVWDAHLRNDADFRANVLGQDVPFFCSEYCLERNLLKE